MSVTNVGASPPPAPPPLLGQRVGKPNPLNTDDNNAVGHATNSLTSKATGEDVVGHGAHSATAVGTNPLPPTQAATTPGTGQKVNIIA
jgi:hypothetical protein